VKTVASETKLATVKVVTLREKSHFVRFVLQVGELGPFQGLQGNEALG